MRITAADLFHAQVDTIFLLSLDLSQALARELGIESFLSPELQRIAREYISQGFLPSGRRHPDLEQLVRRFRLAVSDMGADEVISALESWQKGVFPGHAESVRVWSWTILLQHLCHRWDEGITEEMPISRPDLAGARILIRNYADGLQNIRVEVRATSIALASEWDNMMYESCEDWFGGTALVIDLLQFGVSRRFWNDLRSQVPPADLLALETWGRVEAKKQKMQLRYIRLPKS